MGYTMRRAIAAPTVLVQQQLAVRYVFGVIHYKTLEAAISAQQYVSSAAMASIFLIQKGTPATRCMTKNGDYSSFVSFDTFVMPSYRIRTSAQDIARTETKPKKRASAAMAATTTFARGPATLFKLLHAPFTVRPLRR